MSDCEFSGVPRFAFGSEGWESGDDTSLLFLSIVELAWTTHRMLSSDSVSEPWNQTQSFFVFSLDFFFPLPECRLQAILRHCKILYSIREYRELQGIARNCKESATFCIPAQLGQFLWPVLTILAETDHKSQNGNREGNVLTTPSPV